jgi:hypothetical protein
LKSALLLWLAWGATFAAQAHGFEERYDLPVPLAYVIAGACACVLLTFIVAVVWMRRPDVAQARPTTSTALRTCGAKQPTFCHGLAKGISFFLFVLTLASALWGTRDPLMNLAPTLIWIGWWVGLSFAVIILGNIWPLLDPWRTLFELLNAAVRMAGRRNGIALNWPWPARIGRWPATLLLLVWCGLEVIYPIAMSPFKLGCLAVTWSVFNVTGMVCFGREVWQRHADVFAVYFSALGRQIGNRPTAESEAPVAGEVGFVLAMLSTVLFDGLHGSATWAYFEGALVAWAPQWLDTNGYVAGGIGLITVWLIFVAAYRLTCQLCFALMPIPTSGFGNPLARLFLPTLIPIAAAYLIAHNFSNLLIQGQTLISLLSDPLGRQWDILGTAKFYPDIGLVDAKLTWTVALVAIVGGHVISIWRAHRLALSVGLSAQHTALTSLPLTLLMVVYTGISLMVLAAPMVSNAPERWVNFGV